VRSFVSACPVLSFRFRAGWRRRRGGGFLPLFFPLAPCEDERVAETRRRAKTERVAGNWTQTQSRTGMGLLSLGTPLPWEKAKKHANHVRSHGITQFINVWKKTKDRQRDILLWGDEIEYLVVSYDHAGREAKLSTRVFDILAELSREEEQAVADPTRQLAKEQMNENEVPITLVSFPRLGCEAAIEGPSEPQGPVAQSIYVPDEVINPHARFRTLTANIRCRRGSKVDIVLPLFIDKNPPRPFIDPTIPPKELQDPNIAPTPPARPDTVYMDAMAFGMGCCCLQLTFQACNVEEARRLNDQLAVLAPIMLALTAGSPAWRGLLADVDCRWDVISMSVDDRTEEERGLKVGDGTSGYVLACGAFNMYRDLSVGGTGQYNDIPLVVDEEIVARLKENDVDELLARHVGHLFIRDPL
ncbi:MAG: glutamate-cysteine ligase-domain-containing protein, partial [Olpidium bornovanus]